MRNLCSMLAIRQRHLQIEGNDRQIDLGVKKVYLTLDILA